MISSRKARFLKQRTGWRREESGFELEANGESPGDIYKGEKTTSKHMWKYRIE